MNNNRENPLLTLLFFGTFFGSIGIGFCGVALWNNPLIMFCGFMGSVAVLAVGAAVYFWHQDQVVSGIKEYRVNLPYVLCPAIMLCFLVLLVIGFSQNIAVLSIISAFGVVLSGFLSLFFRNILLFVFVQKSIKKDIHAKAASGVVTAIHEHTSYYSTGGNKTIYKLIIDIDGIKSYCFFRLRDNHDKMPSEGSTIKVLFNHSKPKYCIILD